MATAATPGDDLRPLLCAGLRHGRNHAVRLLRIAAVVRVWLALGAVFDGPCRAEPRSISGMALVHAHRGHRAGAAGAVAAAGRAHRALSVDVSREPRALRTLRRVRRLVVHQIPASDDPARADSRGGGLRRRASACAYAASLVD